jgi:hypothetical protein
MNIPKRYRLEKYLYAYAIKFCQICLGRIISTYFNQIVSKISHFLTQFLVTIISRVYSLYINSSIELYTFVIPLLSFFIEMLQYDWLWSGHIIIKEMFYIQAKLKPELTRASMTTSDVNNQWRSYFQQQII